MSGFLTPTALFAPAGAIACFAPLQVALVLTPIAWCIAVAGWCFYEMRCGIRVTRSGIRRDVGRPPLSGDLHHVQFRDAGAETGAMLE